MRHATAAEASLELVERVVQPAVGEVADPKVEPCVPRVSRLADAMIEHEVESIRALPILTCSDVLGVDDPRVYEEHDSRNDVFAEGGSHELDPLGKQVV